MNRIAYQENQGGIVSLLPDGRVEFLKHEVLDKLKKINDGVLDASSVHFESYIEHNPWVKLKKFRLNAPVIAFIEVTNQCNLRCKHCYSFSAKKRPNEMSTSEIIKIIDDFAEMGVLQVFLTGGEIFSHPDVVQIITHARTKPFTTQIFTNGILISEEALAAIPKGTSFFISFDTAEPTKTIRGGMDFPILKERFDWMKKYGHVLRTAVSVHRNNVDDIEEIFQWCQENHYPRPQWLETHAVGRALFNRHILLQPNDVDRVFEVYKKSMDRFTPTPCGKDDEYEGKKDVRSVDTIKFCQQLEKATGQEKCGRTLCYVNSSGDVYPCSNCMSNKSYKAGNIKSTSFGEIWEKGFDEFRSITFDQFSDCQTCPVQEAGIWCQFRCPPLAKNVSENPLGCGASDYLKIFMLKAEAYWKKREAEGLKLALMVD